MKISKNYFFAVATLVGTIIGAGIFALPILVYSSGILTFLIILAALIGLQYFFHKMYASVILSSEGEHRIPGYVEIYFGRKYKKISSLPALIGGYGALLAYIILGGTFAYELLHSFLGGTVFFYSLAVFLLEAVVVLFGLKMIAKAEFLMSSLLVAIALVVSWKCFSNADLGNFSIFDWKYLPLLYGPVFFSIGGDVAIPEVCKLLKNEKKKIKSAIFWGTVIAGIIIALFVISVVGATGAETTADSLVGLDRVLDGKIIKFALLFGLLNIATSFFTSLQAVREVYWWDFGLDKNKAWILSVIPPILIFLLGARNLTGVVSFTGAVTGGISGIIAIYLARRAAQKPQKKGAQIKVSLSKGLSLVLSAVFVLGVIYELWQVIKGI